MDFGDLLGSRKEVAQTALVSESDQELRVPCYCEENVWRLAVRKRTDPTFQGTEFYVAVISNHQKCIPMLHQKASPHDVCYWDYHVILIGINQQSMSATVYDIDSTLSYGCTLLEYMAKAFPISPREESPYSPLFRIIPADLFVKHFASNRMHMFNAATNKWNAPPPNYRCIEPEKNNLQRYLDFSIPFTENEPQFGSIYKQQDVVDCKFCTHPGTR